MGANSGNVLHVVDSLGLGGTQSILKDYFESRPGDRTIHLYGLRAVPKQIPIAHTNVAVNPSALRFSILPMLDLRRIVRARAIDILHCHLFRAQVFGFLLKTLFFPRIALVFHEHGRAVGQEGESGLEALMFRWFLRVAWRRVDHFICISEHTRKRLMQEIPGAAAVTTVVANPIPLHPSIAETPHRESIRRALAIPDGAFVVGFASRLVERKGWDVFLAAMALLGPRLPVFFALAGDGDDRQKVEARIRVLGLEGRGRMLGHIDWMRRFYGCLDCFVMPSYWEPHGLAHLEAQSFGVPVVVSSVPGLGSTVRAESDALLFEPGDASALADCVVRLASDPALRSRLIAGGVANSARYTMDAFAASLEAIYTIVGSRLSAAGER
jgi:glycosyltransferase involved in cell wall biosynthesis